MLEISVTDFSRNLRKMFDRIEHQKEEIILIRNNQRIARIIPGSSKLTAKEAMSDIYNILSDDAGENWLEDSRIDGNIDQLENPWDS
jgi:PHD/YefM family antitoxin component YafN of YafNO toxin-antitoxin module